jgi:hypothetical protein
MADFHKVDLEMEDRLTEERVAQARAEIAKRLKRVCPTLSPSEFEKLLDRMTLFHCKYDVFPNIPDAVRSAELDRSALDQLRTVRKSSGS